MLTLSRRNLRRPLRAILCAGACSFLGGRAVAQGEAKGATATYSLSFVRGAGAEKCPSRQDLEREVSARLGHRPFDPAAPRSIEILTEKTPEGYRSVVSALESDGTLLGRRVLLGDEPECAPIFSATALAVALLIDPEAALSRDSRANEAVGRFETDEVPRPPPVAPSPPPVPAPAPASPVSPFPPSPPVPAPASRETPIAVFGGDAGMSFGLVPAASPAGGIYFGGRPDGLFGFSLSALYTAKAATSGAATLDVSLTTFGAFLTLSAANNKAYRLLPEAGLLAGALHVAVRGAPTLDAGDQAFVALGFGFRAEVTVIGGFFLTARAGGAVPLLRRSLSAQGTTAPIWTEPLFSALVSGGAGWAFF